MLPLAFSSLLSSDKSVSHSSEDDEEEVSSICFFLFVDLFLMLPLFLDFTATDGALFFFPFSNFSNSSKYSGSVMTFASQSVFLLFVCLFCLGLFFLSKITSSKLFSTFSFGLSNQYQPLQVEILATSFSGKG